MPLAHLSSRQASSGLWLRFVLTSLALAATAVNAQDANVRYPIAYIEGRLLHTPLEILEMEQARPSIEGDRSARVTLASPSGGEAIGAKWKPVHAGAQGFNNEPRYELAAYRFQTLFLDEEEYVVPPTVLRSKTLEEYRALRPAAEPTLRGTSSVLFLLSYWVEAVTNRDPFRAELFETDLDYARHWGNLNILTHLINHADGNIGNLLISSAPDSRRVFSVDNDVAFRSEVSRQGNPWSRLHVTRLPHGTIERLRALTLDDLDAAMGVVAEFAVVDGHLVPVEPGPNLDRRRGVRIRDDRVQFGLTSVELGDVESRIQRLLRRVDRGRLETF
jgi:hypothetical protein